MEHRFQPTSYHNSFGSHPPVAHVGDGDRIITTTLDCRGHDAGDRPATATLLAVAATVYLVVRVVMTLRARDAPRVRPIRPTYTPPPELTPGVAARLLRDVNDAEGVVAEVLDLAVESPAYQVAGKGAVPYLDASCTFDRQGGGSALFVLNRDLEKAHEVEVVWRDAAPRAVTAARVLTGTDLKAVNTFAEPTKVAPRELAPPRPGDRMTLELPPRSYAALEFSL